MLDEYLEIFYATCIQFVGILPAVFAIFLLFTFIGSLLFDR